MTEEERDSVNERAKQEGMTLSAYARRSILNRKMVSKTDVQTVFELNKIGNNLNQLAKHVNSLPVDDNILASLSDIKYLISQIRSITEKLL